MRSVANCVASLLVAQLAERSGLGLNKLLGLCLPGSRGESSFSQELLRAHDMQDKDLVSVMAIKNTARWLHYLTITGSPELLGTATAVGVINKPLNVAKDTFYKLSRRDWILQGNIVSNGIKIGQCRL